MTFLSASFAAPTQAFPASAAVAAAGFAIDLGSDMCAKNGKVIMDRDVILQASDTLRHVSSYYTRNDANPLTSALGFKHEFVVLESDMKQYYCVQKNPATGDVICEVRPTMRQACDCGMRAAKRPGAGGEIRLRRTDHEFDLPEDLQVGYLIAWLRKEDARWSLTTENSRHFTIKLRWALNDF